MNTTNVTTGGYVGSEMYKKNLENAKTITNAAFQGSVLTHREYLCNAVANDLKSISTNTTNYTEMTVIFYSVTFQSSMTILSMRLPNENC